ncbi:hypothetical protein SLEP1_g41548 [Rubroshorea leprosula]|uniref:Uncharacterized protein n=1 Tax=Rubroshorea leprosula TaxID=152421 RepID=A0AAV5L6Z5_9ROSI|nr:hypothetical protein SLEP1_g41548 [Rubroshorea leprosula]
MEFLIEDPFAGHQESQDECQDDPMQNTIAAPQADFSGAEFLSPQEFYQPQPVEEMVAGDLQSQQPPPQQPLQTQPVLVEATVAGDPQFQQPPPNPPRPVQFPTSSSQMIGAQSVQYPPQSMQAIPSKPAQFPPQNPQINLAYPSGLRHQPVPYPPQSPQVSQAQQHPGTYHRPPNMPPNLPSSVVQPTFHQHSTPTQPPETQFPQKDGAQGAYVGKTIPPLPYQPPVGTTSGIRTPAPRAEGWRTGLFNCLEDPMNALVTAFFPCLTFGQIVEIVDGGHTCNILSCTYRTKLRNMFSLAESPAPDWVKHCFCERCALCQEYRELRQRGWDPAIGWHGNLNQQAAMTPPMNQTMTA